MQAYLSKSLLGHNDDIVDNRDYRDLSLTVYCGYPGCRQAEEIVMRRLL